MRIKGWQIDGYGAFADHKVTEIPSGLSVYLGPNEAGKSTLMAFVRGMLFGFPTGNTREPKYPPQRGSRHGGRLYLADGERTIVIEREAGSRGAIQVLQDGSPVPELQLAALLGGCDAKVFRSVFAFGLTELQQLNSLDRGELRDRFFAAGVVGAGRSAISALREVNERKATLLKQRTSSRARVNDLLREIEVKNSELRHAHQETARYFEYVRSIDDANSELERLQTAMESARNQEERANTLINLWPAWHERSEALLTVEQARPDDKLIVLADEIDSLHADISRYRDWLEHRKDVSGRRELAMRALQMKLSDLGPSWNRDHLACFNRSIPKAEEVRGYQERLDGSALALARAESVAETAHQQVAQAQASVTAAETALAETVEPPSTSELEAKADAVRRLRANLADFAAAENRRRVLESTLEGLERLRREAELSAPSTASVVVIGAGVIAVSLFTAAAWQGSSGRLSTAMALIAVATVFVCFAWWERRRIARSRIAKQRIHAEFTTRLNGTRSDLNAVEAQLRKVVASIRSDAVILEINERPTNHDVEAADRSVVRATDSRRAFDEANRQVSTHRDLERNRKDEHVRALREVDQAKAAQEETQAAWQEWKQLAGVPAELSPQGVLDFFEAIRVGREQLSVLEEAEREAFDASNRIERFDQRVRAVLAPLGSEELFHTVGVIEALGTLHRRVEHDRAIRKELSAHQETAVRCARQLTEALGKGDRALAVQNELSTGEVERWRANAVAAGTEIEAIQHRRERVVADRREAEVKRDQLETSADIARVELEIASLTEELRVAVHDWRVLSLAEGLIRETLARYERERQPEVLQHASQLFSRVTKGQHTRLYRPLDENTGLSIEDREGFVRRPDELSRGTMEQLYLCIRLGLASSFTQRMGSLPLLMDDVLVNFDPSRARTTAEILRDFAADHQVLIFTCQPQTAELFREIHPGAALFKLEPFGGGGSWLSVA